jgi:hypothetical protein
LAGHFECIGFNTDSQQDFLDRMTLLANSAQPYERRDGGRTLIWRDGSGASLVFNINRRDEIECINPTFVGESRVPVRTVAFVKNRECEHCDIASVEVTDQVSDPAMYPMFLQIENIALVRHRIPMKIPVTATIAGLAERIQVWRDRDAYANDDANIIMQDPPKRGGLAGPIRWGEEMLIPAGMFTTGNQAATSHIDMAGTVLRAQRLLNEETLVHFQWALVRTYGATIDILAAVTDVPTPLEPGNVVRGMFWCIGRVVEGLNQPRKGLIGRMFPS